jgi:hypothetical protein
MAGPNTKPDVIVHLVEKRTSIRLLGFCLVVDGESYCEAQEKILRLIAKELGHSEK